jgi:hypothetical protein
LINRIFGKECRSLSSPLCSFLPSPVTSSVSSENIISLRGSLNVSDQVSHPYTRGKIIILYVLIFAYLDGEVEDKRFYTE